MLIVTEHAIDRFLLRADDVRRIPRDRAKVRALLETMAAHAHPLAITTARGAELLEFGSVVLIVRRRSGFGIVVTVLHWRQLLAHGVAK